MNFELIIETSNGKYSAGLIDFEKDQNFSVGGFEINTIVKNIGDCIRMDIKAIGKERAFITVRCNYENAFAYTFSGEKTTFGIYRQSPHDPKDHKIDTPKEAVPMVAVKKDGEFTVLMSDNPATYDNYTTQTVCPEENYVEISSGDGAETTGGTIKFSPYYTENPEFTTVLFKSTAKSLIDFRKDIFYAIDKVFGSGENSKFHAICFSSNYMHYRLNDKGTSKYWVVPGIEYCNKQYIRDSFWQSMIFPLEMEQQCYDALEKGICNYAENALIFIIWSYRLEKRGGKADPERIEDALNYIKTRVEDNLYITGVSKTLVLRSWYDICGFEHDDALSYNHGIFVAALIAAEKMGIKTEFNIDEAIRKYNEMFLPEKGYIPISIKKPQILCLDPTVGDLLSYVLFDRKLLSDEIVKTHYQTTFSAANTDSYGAKITCLENGDYCTIEDYSAYGEVSPELKNDTPGYYSWGGSYYIYEMLFHMAGYIHNVPGAEENMIKRSKLDFEIGGTYFEHINTVNGDGNKANQGWNCCVYPLWQSLIDKGIADDKFFREMEKML